MIQGKEFALETLPEAKFRVGKVTPPEILALTTQMGLKDFNQTTELFTYALEHTETEIEPGKWVPVKSKNQEVYYPWGIEDNLLALQEICNWFMENVIYKNFLSSAE